MTIRRHSLALILAAVIGLIYVFPHLYFIGTLGSNYKGIYISRSYDEEAYDAMVRQVYDGVPVTDNPYIVEYKAESIGSYYNWLQSILGHGGTLFHIPFDWLMIISKFVFPALLVLVIYALVWLITKDKIQSALASAFVLLGCELAPLSMGSLVKTLAFHSPFHNFLFFNRPINPQMSALVFFLTLISLWLVYEKPTWKRSIFSGICLGVISYIYFYYWNFSMILAGVVCIYALAAGNWSLLKKISASIGLGLVVALPFLISILNLMNGGGEGAAINKNYILTHEFIPEKIMILPLIFFMLVWLWNFISKKLREKNPGRKYADLSFLAAPQYIFVFLLACAGFIASEQQVIHGYEIQQHHYHFMTNIPVFILFLSIIIPALCKKYLGKYWAIIPTIMLIVVLWHGVSVQAMSYKTYATDYVKYQEYAQFFDWLNQNSPVNSVVYSDNFLSEIIPVYTHDAIYSSLHASVYPVPLERLEYNFFVEMHLDGVTGDQAHEYMYKEETRNKIGQYIFEGQYWRAVCGSFGCFPDSMLDDLIAKYKTFLKTDFEKNLKKYAVNYVLWDSSREPGWKIDQFKFLTKVLENGSVKLYKVK